DKGGKDWDRIGDAVHAYLGLPLASLSEATARAAAERILDRWNADTVLSAETLLEIGRRWTEWIDTTFPGAEVFTEQPIAWRNDDDQVMEGWVDTLIVQLDGSYVLVDHKSYPGSDAVREVQTNYIGQVTSYTNGLSAIIGEAPSNTLIHLPLRAEIIEIRNSA
ncbi:MAG: UvrD-helicase domain-containing protein, partial [Canibacter sp.]